MSLLATFVALNFLAFAFGIGLAFSFSFLSLGLLAGLVEPTVHQLVTGFSTTVASSLELRLAVLAFAERLAVALALRLAAALAFPERVYLHRRRIVGTGHAGVQLPPDDQVDKRVLHLVVCVEAAGVRVDCRLQLLRDASHDHCHLNLVVQAQGADRLVLIHHVLELLQLLHHLLRVCLHIGKLEVQDLLQSGQTLSGLHLVRSRLVSPHGFIAVVVLAGLQQHKRTLLPELHQQGEHRCAPLLLVTRQVLHRHWVCLLHRCHGLRGHRLVDCAYVSHE